MNSFCFFALLHTTETPNETFSCFCTRQKHQMKLFHASAHDRNTKWNFFVLLHATETPNEIFSCFCSRQKHQLELFGASAHDRNAKWNFFALLHTAERPKRIFYASAHCRNTKWNFFMLLHTTETPNETFSCFCTRQKHQMKLFHASAHVRYYQSLKSALWNLSFIMHFLIW